MANGNRILAILGVDSEGKGHAARFNASDEAAVRKAASLMSMRVGIAKTDKALALAHKLPEGKLFESGKAMIPLAKEEAFYALTEHLTFDQLFTSTGLVTGPSSTPISSLVKAADVVWSAIEVGSLVLVFDNTQPEFPSWSAAIVVAIAKDGESLTARWRDFPGFKTFVTKVRSLGILRPDIAS